MNGKKLTPIYRVGTGHHENRNAVFSADERFEPTATASDDFDFALIWTGAGVPAVKIMTTRIGACAPRVSRSPPGRGCEPSTCTIRFNVFVRGHQFAHPDEGAGNGDAHLNSAIAA